jgi:hypothetical protein
VVLLRSTKRAFACWPRARYSWTSCG